MEKKRHLEGNSFDERIQMALGKTENMSEDHHVMFNNIIERYRLLMGQWHNNYTGSRQIESIDYETMNESTKYIEDLLKQIDNNNNKLFNKSVQIRMEDSDYEDVEKLLKSLEARSTS
uniref:Uncharacterized protein n=1 Tax=uncultured marine group II/III euryarchaeote AD1000_88_G11 TaxID=1457822 RepID=A0A075G0M5_9EURY|nr:hypothetical protein [uncultured marine group II/III euryarchaeote AD1000_88_G11]